MEFKSRFVRSLPVIALMAGLLVPFKPVAAAEGPYTAVAPGVSAAPAAQMTAGDPAAADELDATGKLRQPGHGKKRQLTAPSDELVASGIIRKPVHKKRMLAAATDELDATGKLRQPGHGKKRQLTAPSDQSIALKFRHKPHRA